MINMIDPMDYTPAPPSKLPVVAIVISALSLVVAILSLVHTLVYL